MKEIMVLVIVGILILLNGNVSWIVSFASDPAVREWAPILIDSAVAFGTIFLAIMAYKSIREGRKIENVKIHTAELKKVLQQWEGSLPEIQPAYAITRIHDDLGFIGDESFLFTIEAQFFFSDIPNHLPHDYLKLNKKWSDFKDLVEEYNKKRLTLFENIEQYFQEKVSSYPTKGYTIQSAFHIPIYMEAVSSCMSMSSGYEYQVEGKQILYKEIRQGYVLAEVDSGVAKIEQIKDDIKEIHRNMISECISKYNKEIKEIIDDEVKLRRYRDELKMMLKEVNAIPLLPKDCKFIKNAFK